MLDAVKRLLLREAQVQPLLVVEDLHWIDSETQALLDSLVESLPPSRLLLFVNYRPEYEHRWGSKTSYTQLRLDLLPPESAVELLRGLLGADGTIEPLTSILIERTEGNPFFLEETVRALVETRALVGERGAYRLAKVLTDIQVPSTVQAILAARIDRLSPEDKRLLQSAAVIGKDVPFALLAAVAEEREEDLRRGLARLQAAEFLYETSLLPDLEYTLKHALTHEVAYGSLLGDRRRASHARIVEDIEAAHPDRLAEHAERLGHHASRGEVWDKAVAYLRQAGAKAIGHSAYREAVTFFEQALEALQHLPDNSHTREQNIDLRLDMRSALSAFGEFRRILTVLREADTLATTLDDSRRLGRISTSMSQYFNYAGDYERAVAASQRALALATISGNVATRHAATMFMGGAYFGLGDYRPAIDRLRQNVTAEAGESIRERAINRSWLAWSLAEVGAFVEANAWGEEGIRLAEAVDHPWSLVLTCGGAGLASLRQGDLSKAIPLLERGRRLCQSAQLPLFFPRLASALASRGTGLAPARRPLPPRPQQALPPHGQARAGPRALHHCDDDVPRDGHAVLSGARGGRDEGVGMSIAVLIAILGLHPRKTRATGGLLLHKSREPGVSLLLTGSRGPKGIFGSRSPAGSRFAERMLTIAATLKQQDRNVVDYITAACVASLHGGSAPSLLPTQQSAA